MMLKERDLNFFQPRVGQLIDGEDAADWRSGEQPVVHGELAGKIFSAAQHFGGVDVADQIGDGYVNDVASFST